jgi:hypothetical protein
MNETKKVKLLEALKEERQRFSSYGHNTEEHDRAILYLEKGIKSPTEYGELLDSILNDFNTVCKDYQIEA